MTAFLENKKRPESSVDNPGLLSKRAEHARKIKKGRNAVGVRPSFFAGIHPAELDGDI